MTEGPKDLAPPSSRGTRFEDHSTGVNQLKGRIDELAALQPGWLDGGGEALPLEGLSWLHHLLTGLMAAQGLPRPLMYAMPQGAVQAVWRPLPWRVEAEFDLHRRRVSLLAVNLETDEDADAEFGLDTQGSHQQLLDFVTRTSRGDPPGWPQK